MLERRDLDALVDALRADGRTVLGPVRRDGAVTIDEVTDASELAVGAVDEHAPGRYRLADGDGDEVFAAVIGQASWKRHLLPPATVLSRTEGGRAAWREVADGDAPARTAFLGVRACDVAAIAVLDRVMAGGAHVDHTYAERRGSALVVAVTCSRAVDTCFCVSMGTGPRPSAPHDILLTEIRDGDRHHFVVESGSPEGDSVLERLPLRPATAEEAVEAHAVAEHTAASMRRSLDASARQALAAAPDHPRWDDVAGRCLACGNCTMVCPTCFCTTVDDRTALVGDTTERVRTWDSCFSLRHSYIHGGPVRPQVRSRYRQWLTHKLSTWHDQYGTSGCTGCGRCITWCPVGIDITEEAAAITATASGGTAS